MGSTRRSFIFALLCLWIMTTGSTCQSTFQGSTFQAQGQGAGVILVVLVGAGVACLANLDDCGGREPTPLERVHKTFESGLALLDRGDPSGLDLICLAGLQGDPQAQYFYGVHLLRRDPAHVAESLAWLRRAAAQDHKAARYVLVQMADRRRGASTGPLRQPLAVAPPALQACVTRPPAGKRAHALEALSRAHDPRG